MWQGRQGGASGPTQAAAPGAAPDPAGAAAAQGARAEAAPGAAADRPATPGADRTPVRRALPALPAAAAPDPAAIARLGAARCLARGWLPLPAAGLHRPVALADPARLAADRAELEALLGPVLPLAAPRARIEAALARAAAPDLARRAERRTAESESCRDFARRGLRRRLGLAAAVLAVWALAAPGTLGLAALTAGLIAMAAGTGLKAAAAWATRAPAPPGPPPPAIARPPVVSVLVALYRESGIAARLVQRLGRLDWPRDRLDILLVVEDDDRATRAALDRPDLPGWMRVLVVPPGTLKTKPRALNYALDFCRGSIVGIYDAEDAPEPDQIRKVVARFHARPRTVACLQGVLAFYNPRSNWLSRCFAVDYAAWFRVVLPGLDRLGLPVPLGGTTVFLRREALEEVGAWDAHNVTEDADLGIRLARRGYRTELIDSVTFEEANCRVIPWIRQRSRWLKGYMMTWAVHMRAPILLWRQLGPAGFLGFQALFLGTIAQLLLTPLILSFWVAGPGWGHPLARALPSWGLGLLVGTCLLAEAVTLVVNGLGLRRSGQPVGMGTLPLMHLYGPLAALAAWRGLWDLARRPFHWDKTAHGLHQPGAAPAARAGGGAAPSAFRRAG